MWSKRSPDLEKYVKYLSGQDEIYQNGCLVTKEKTSKNCKKKHCIIEPIDSKKKFIPYKIKKKTKKEYLVTTSALESHLRVEDVYINPNS